MDRKRARKGKHLFLYFACFLTMLFGMLGCINLPKKWQGEQHLVRARVFMDKGDYEASLKENKEVLRLFPKTLGDQALFQMGLIYAHPDNPNPDCQKSLKCFQRLIKEYPKSNTRDEAETQVLFLQRLNKEISILKRRLQEEKKRVNNLEDQIEKLKEIDLGIEEKKREDLQQ